MIVNYHCGALTLLYHCGTLTLLIVTHPGLAAVKVDVLLLLTTDFTPCHQRERLSMLKREAA